MRILMIILGLIVFVGCQANNPEIRKGMTIVSNSSGIKCVVKQVCSCGKKDIKIKCENGWAGKEDSRLFSPLNPSPTKLSSKGTKIDDKT